MSRFIALILGLAMVVHAAPAPVVPFTPYSWNENRYINGEAITAEFHQKFVNFTNGAEWKPIELNFQKTGTGFYLSNAPYALHLPLFADGPARFVSTNKYDVKNKAIRNDPPVSKVKRWVGAAHVPGTVTPDGILYKDALSVGDIIYQPHQEEFLSLVRINSEPAGTGDVVIPFTENYSDGLSPKSLGRSIGTKDSDVGRGFGVSLNAFRGISTKPAMVWDSADLEHRQDIVIKGRFVGGVFIGAKIIPRSFFKNAVYPVYTDTTSTFFPDAGNPGTTTMDASFLKSSGVSYATVHDSLTADSVEGTSTSIYVQNSQAGGYDMRRLGVTFDTSSLGVGAVISSVVTSLWGKSKVDGGDADSIRLVSFAPVTNNLFVVADFNKTSWGTTAYATDKTIAAITTGAYNDYTENATGIADVSLTGITKRGFRALKDVNNQTPANQNYVEWASADTASTTNDPKMVITFTVAASGPTNKNHLMFFY